MEEERQALAAFVKRFDSLGLGLGIAPPPPPKFNPPLPTPGGAAAIFAQRQGTRHTTVKQDSGMAPLEETEFTISPVRMGVEHVEPSLLEEEWDAVEDVSFSDFEKAPAPPVKSGLFSRKASRSPSRDALVAKENVPV